MTKLVRYCWIVILFAAYQNIQAQSLNDYISQLNKAKNDNEKIELLKKIGLTYQKQKGYSKAAEYYQKAYDLEKNNSKPLHQQGETLKDVALAHLLNQNYTKAQESYLQVLAVEKSDNNQKEIKETLEALASIATTTKNYQNAINYYKELTGYYQDDLSNLANTYNNIGFNYKKINDSPKALENFNQSIRINEQIVNQQAVNPNTKAIALTNIGSTYTNEGEYRKAEKYYEEALKIRESQGNKVEIAKIKNFLGVNEFLANRTDNALSNVDEAISLAQSELGGANKSKAQEALMSSYQIKASIAQQQQDLKEYQKNNQKYLDLQKEYQEELNKQRQEAIAKELELEKKENEVKTELAEKDKQEMELVQERLEKEKAKKEAELKESEIQRLRADSELQQQRIRNADIEKQRSQQQLELLQQKAEADKNQQQIAFLEKDKELQSQKRETERKEEERKREVLAKEKQLSDLKAKEEEQKTFYAVVGLAIVGVFLVYVAYLLVLNRKKNKKLAEQNATIEEQNGELQAQTEELKQNQEEIMAQRDAIAQKNDVLAEQNEKIEKSINAAKTIQAAILPYPKQLNSLLGEHFVIFRPRDVVSGDFYWLNEVNGKTFVAAADCTGHGVPGAFMSLISNNLLNKIVLINRVTEPSEILENLHQEIQLFLRQKETNNRDGLDIVLCVIDKQADESAKILFAGAKRPLFYTEGNDNQVFSLKGSRKSIGGEQNETIRFETQSLLLSKNSCIYLSSDGIADQNDADRVKLGESKLKYTISSVANLPMQEQKESFEKLLDQHQKGTIQRDDILFIGIRI
ncbi:MAG: tetratricopeptide repeat protein [Thermonemataceae bacterium]|nr:tetratricopeptide repeat protein [Thermonemataceae bacterium]